MAEEVSLVDRDASGQLIEERLVAPLVAQHLRQLGAAVEVVEQGPERGVPLAPRAQAEGGPELVAEASRLRHEASASTRLEAELGELTDQV